MPRKRNTIEGLRTAIDCMPVATRQAMLEGVRANDILVGAYTDRDGGVCPMLAAHRNGGRTDFLAFARAWDRFGQSKNGRSRRASEREVGILISHLEASLMGDYRPELEAAIDDHRRLRAQRAQARQAARERKRARHPRPGDADRSRQLRRRAGWTWLRPFRRYDDYARALARVEAERDALEAQRSEHEFANA